jgi:hypothetical protein
VSATVPLRRPNAGATKPRSGGTGKIVAISFGIVALVGVGAWLIFMSRALRVPTDAVTLCPTDRDVSGITVVLLDLSSALSAPQGLDVRNQLVRVRNAVPTFGRIEIYVVDSVGERVIQPVVALCNPGTGEEMNRLYQNPELARKRWEEEFASTLEGELDSLLGAPDSPTSPIFEAIQATSLRTFGNPSFDAVVERQLIVVSDLMQNTPRLRMYSAIPDFADFSSTSAFADVRANLAGVGVTVFYLQGPNASQRWPAQIDFWSRYFEAQGAALDRVVPISGAR